MRKMEGWIIGIWVELLIIIIFLGIIMGRVQEDTMYCNICHQPKHGLDLCPEWKDDGQDRYVPEKIIEIEWDEWPVGGD